MSSAVPPVRAEYPPDARSPLAARRLVLAALHDWGLDHLVASAGLLVSELATNAVLHAGTRFRVQVEQLAEAVRITVLDCSPVPPSRRRYGLGAATGRGLGLVASMSSDWGTRTDTGPWVKAVWFELPTDPARLPLPADGALLERAPRPDG